MKIAQLLEISFKQSLSACGSAIHKRSEYKINTGSSKHLLC